MTGPGRRRGEDSLRRPELRPLWHAVHDRLSSGRRVSRVRLGPLDDAEREALADLLGLDRLPEARPTVAMLRLEEAVTELSGRTVRETVTALVGPLGDRAADRRRRESDRADLWTWLDGHAIVRAQPALSDWAASCRAAGPVGGSVEHTRSLLTDALTVLAELPAPAEPLPVFAARVLDGHAHALDDGTPVSGLVLRALAALHDTDPPRSAADRRALWARAGVAADDLSATVLVGGLRPLGDGPLARVARVCAEAGQATCLTLAQLRAPGEFALAADPVPVVVHAVENPSVLALAVRRFGPDCPPLVCTSGWPNSAVIGLLRMLAEHGAALRHHGDFDGEGIRIAAYIMDRTPARPWRMTAADYRTAVARNPHGPSAGRITEAPWDAELAGAMAEHGSAVVEELVAEVLLDDLAGAVARQGRTGGS
ncbi:MULTISPECIES: TIGR02679 family protein [unclassified Streptomyces]|uniref:TIGR02679 family protein n=1 Tax=unclassified Streptomyces TaxID=2593676 RepID=UPI001F035690|nr:MULTISPECIES: TIGR02679 family protein [unclassified Streptomyces]MCH0561770.1 TIGR02679 family protein [Streptomyces sp. MUM 2J]MCH0571620.1 TIGR02679 family protein [Streptomyces sp. MUM 136J]